MIVLTYHAVHNIRRFEEQIRHLVSHQYNVLSLRDFIDRYAQKKLTSADVLITFDDGDYSVLDHAMPVLKKYGCPAVMFVITGLIGTHLPFWWEEIRYYCPGKEEVNRAKLISNDERLKFLENLRASSNRAALNYRQLTWEDLSVMEQGGISIANHSHTHPMFDKLSATEVKNELVTSSAFLKKNGFQFHDIFAYPNGNYSSAVEEIMSKLGIRLAFLFDHKLNVTLDKPYRISRLSVNDATPMWKFRLMLSGLHSRIVPISKKIHQFIHK
jgi:poly-beta-1,6-N-acetyl-D-glucosamine N-deacetylase